MDRIWNRIACRFLPCFIIYDIDILINMGTNDIELKYELKKQFSIFSGMTLFFYLGIIVYFVFFSDKLGRTVGYNDYQYNLMPFQEIHRYLAYRDYVPDWVFVLNLLGNLLIFAPIGLLVPVMRMKKTSMVRVIIYAFIASLSIELLQLVTKVGVFDVDDLILNTTGSLIGWLLYLLSRFAFQKQWTYLEEKNKHEAD